MAIEIPNDIEAQYKKVVSKLKNGYVTFKNYKEQIINKHPDTIMEINNWYLIDISGNGFLRGNKSDKVLEAYNINLIYVEEYDDKNWAINGYYIDCKSVDSCIVIDDNGLDYWPKMNYHKGYGVGGCSFILIEIDENPNFINWINRDPMGAKE